MIQKKMKYSGISALCLAILVMLFSSSSKDAYRAYIEKYSSVAVAEMKRSGVPASITMAQALLESAAGQSGMAVKAKNHFGVKCHRDWKGKTMDFPAESGDECFRVYSKVEDSFRDHSDFLRYQSRYKFLFDLDRTDYKGWATGLRKAGYATDPAYPVKLVRIIEEYDLSRLDKDVDIALPAPSVAEVPKEIELKEFREMFMVALQRKVFVQNGAMFVYAVEGDSYSSIASTFSLFDDEILRYNDVSSDASFRGGEMVYLRPKRKMAAVGVEKYIVGPDELVTLWDLSQKYGVKLGSLCRMNGLDSDADLKEGDTVILRK